MINNKDQIEALLYVLNVRGPLRFAIRVNVSSFTQDKIHYLGLPAATG